MDAKVITKGRNANNKKEEKKESSFLSAVMEIHDLKCWQCLFFIKVVEETCFHMWPVEK